MPCRARGAQKLLSAMLVALCLLSLQNTGTGTELRGFEGPEPFKEVSLEPPELEATVNISVPKPSTPLSATMNISTMPGPKCLGPVVDVGDDGTAEWRFDGTGYGPLGLQNSFSDGLTSHSFTVSTSTTSPKAVKLPKGATINSASMSFDAAPTDPTPASTSAENLDIGPSQQKTFHISDIPQ
ncbi:MAG: hypothetical protein QXD84_08965, partial [Thermoplasmata archaeon]